MKNEVNQRISKIFSLALIVFIANLLIFAPDFFLKKQKKITRKVITTKIVSPIQASLPVTKEADKSIPEILAENRNELEEGIRYHKFLHGNTSKREIAITFDDGPHPKFTAELLRILKENNIKATFFLVGKMAEKYPDLVTLETSAGHSIGNHTYNHINLKEITKENVAYEIQKCEDSIAKITGRKTNLFRPPGGAYDNDVMSVVEGLKYSTVLWTANGGDWYSPGKKIIKEKVLTRTKNGGIILLCQVLLKHSKKKVINLSLSTN